MKKPHRRDFFSRIGDGLHGAALAWLLRQDLGASERRTSYNQRPRSPHFEPTAKSVIHLFMNGGPSQVDLFNPKPELEKYAGAEAPRDIVNQIEFTDEVGTLMPSPYRFRKQGECGMEISELLPGLGGVVDDVTLIRSMYGEHFNHEPSLFLIHSGRTLPGRPALGAWIVYGLGAENQNLPGYVVLDDPKGYPVNDLQNWQSGWLPQVYQGTKFRAEGPPVLSLRRQQELPSPLVEAERALVRRLNLAHRDARPLQPQLDARIESYELAARTQLAATDVADLSSESEETKEMYGMNDERTRAYGARLLLARRMIERGVRFVQVFIEYQISDNHLNLGRELRYACEKTDRPVAALIRDLKQRGLLDSTLVIWGGEFGRMLLAQAGQAGTSGRDHGPAGFSMCMAGGGVKGGHIHGATDEIGHRAVEDRVSVHDFHATMLHLLGLDPESLVFNVHGLDERLIGQYPARVVREILA